MSKSIKRQSPNLQSLVEHYLYNQNLPALRKLKIREKNGSVTIRGTVQWFYERQKALSCLKHVEGVERVIDHMDVN